MTIKVGSIAVIKLITTEELIGKVETFTADAIALENVLGVGYQMDPHTPGKIGFGFIPFSPMTTGKVKHFDRIHVVMVDEPTGQLKQAYEQATGAIVTPNKTLILDSSPS